MSFNNHIQYNNFYYNNLCHVCKESNQNLKRCSSCKTVAYCSTDHQKEDWKYHKSLCAAIAKSSKHLTDLTVEDFGDFIKYNVSKSVLWHRELSRELSKFECQMWMFPRVCAECFSDDVSYDCRKCLNVSYCSVLHIIVHEPKHSKFCASLKLCMDIDLYRFHLKFMPCKINVCDFESAVNKLPKNLEELLSMYEKSEVPYEDLDEKIQFIIKADLIAPAATILYGMEKSGLLKDRVFHKSDLTVHIVGADRWTEMGFLWKLIIELPFHWIKNLKSLVFCVVGPELNYENSTDKFTKQLCNTCKSKNPATNIIFRWKLYHNITESLQKPDIVVAFNSGLHEFGDNSSRNSWHKSIDCLTMHSDVPLLLTAYTMSEIKADVDVVRSRSSHEVLTVLEPQRNPFSNMTPLRDWETEDSPIFYVNGYLAILMAV